MAEDLAVQLYKAADKRSIMRVEQLLAAGANPNVVMRNGATALYIASVRGSELIVKALLQAGADPVAVGFQKTGATPLYVAAERGYNAIVYALLEKIDTLDAATKLAAIDVEVVISPKQQIRATPLYVASEIGNANIVGWLLERGANANKPLTNDPQKTTPLFVAVEKESIETVQKLLDAGANPSTPLDNEDHTTPLYVALDLHNTELVRLLLEKGADADAALNDERKTTPLIKAIEDSQVEAATLLLGHGADADKVVEDDAHTTPLYLATAMGFDTIVELLLSKGADPNKELTDEIKSRPLTVAVAEDRDGIVGLLLDKGAKMSETFIADGISPLYLAAANGSMAVAALLLDRGAPIDGAAKNGHTPLYIAAAAEEVEMVEFLLERGAKADIPAHDGKTMKELADSFSPEIKALITGAGATAKWKGWTRSDAERFDTIFSIEPDAEGKVAANDYACCPVCLKFVERSEACMYMKHKCPDQKGYYHAGLYKKYRNSEGYISWCTICGRCAIGHSHYALAKHSAPKAAVIMGGDPFEKDCRISNHGGGLPEKLARFRALRAAALGLQEQVDKISERGAQARLVEASWDGPFDDPAVLEAIVATKSWNIPHAAFPANVAVANANVGPAPNIPLPEDTANPNPDDPKKFIERTKAAAVPNDAEFDDPLTFETLEKDAVIVKFAHIQERGGVPQLHKISFQGLQEYLEAQLTQFGTPKFAECFMAPECNCHIFPKELEEIKGEGMLPEELVEKYRLTFNKRFADGGAPQRGGALTAIVPSESATTSFFGVADNAVCDLPDQSGGRRRRRRKTRARRNRKTRRLGGRTRRARRR